MSAFKGMKKEDITQPLIIDTGFRLGEVIRKVQTTPYSLNEEIYLHKSTQGVPTMHLNEQGCAADQIQPIGSLIAFRFSKT